MIAKLKAYVKSRPVFKKFVLFALMPRGQARPRPWVHYFINPLVHKRGKGSRICPSVRMDVLPFNTFRLGRRSTIEDFATINNGMGDVLIGQGTRVGIGNVIIGPVTIGNNVILAQNVVLSGINHSYTDITVPIKDQPCSVGPISVGDNSWIGANAVITSGVNIGNHCVIAAGSVVIKDVPSFSVAAGNPAKIIKTYNRDTGSWEKITAW